MTQRHTIQQFSVDRGICREATGLGEIIKIPVELGDYKRSRTINISPNSVIFIAAYSADKHNTANVVSRAWLSESSQTKDFNREIWILRVTPNRCLHFVVEPSDTTTAILEYCEGSHLFTRLSWSSC
jgi:hypothetical protein